MGKLFDKLTKKLDAKRRPYCAALVAAVLCGHADRKVQMKLAGGNLMLNWNAEDNHVYQTGPAAFVFDGEWLG